MEKKIWKNFRRRKSRIPQSEKTKKLLRTKITKIKQISKSKKNKKNYNEIKQFIWPKDPHCCHI